MNVQQTVSNLLDWTVSQLIKGLEMSMKMDVLYEGKMLKPDLSRAVCSAVNGQSDTPVLG